MGKKTELSFVFPKKKLEFRNFYTFFYQKRMYGSKAKTEILLYVKRGEREANQFIALSETGLFFSFSCQISLLPLTNQSMRKIYYCSCTGVVELAWI